MWIRLLSILLHFIAAIITFVAYGYFEAVAKQSCTIVFLLSYYLYSYSKFRLPVIVFSPSYAVAWYTANFPAILLSSFLVLLLCLIFIQYRAPEDVIVKLRPYEAEIRQFLWDKDPSMIGKVDHLLFRYQSREKELYKKLVAKYSVVVKPINSSQSLQAKHNIVNSML